MATRELIRDMITSFCDLFARKLDPRLVDSWMTALQRYDDDRIRDGGLKAMEECQRMPTPQDVITRMPKEKTEETQDYVFETAKCSLCGSYGRCIKEDPYSDTWRCRECYTGLTAAQHAAKMREIINAMGIKEM